MMKKLLAADIGGSKTRIQLLDTSGSVLSETVTAGVAYAVDDSSPLPPLENLLAAIEEKETVVAVAVNLGGRNTKQIRLSFRKFFPDTGIDHICSRMIFSRHKKALNGFPLSAVF